MKTYDYKITDTANDKVNNSELKAEIQSSGKITVAVTDVRTTGATDLHIDFPKDLPDADEKTELDALVAAHTGESSLPVQKVQIQHASEPGLNLFVHGVMFFADTGKSEEEGGQVTEHDFVLPEEREIEGAMAHVHDHCPGDKLDFEFWAPTGLEAPAPTEVMVGRNGCDVFVPPSGVLPEIRSDSTKPLPAGVFVRVRYTCLRPEATPRPRVAVNFRWHRKEAT